jgi:pimeloyl-ACP methyl ester carboxylesterase
MELTEGSKGSAGGRIMAEQNYLKLKLLVRAAWKILFRGASGIQEMKTVETVRISHLARNTQLKLGVNEKRMSKVSYVPMRKLPLSLTLFLAVCWISHGADAVSDRISVSVRGKGPDVVLIPGLACSNAVWDATAKHLESRYCLHLVQVAGFAGSPARGNANGAIVQPTANAINAYIKTQKLKTPSVIGHSLGGFIGLLLAAEHPGDIGKVMVVDALPFFGVLMGAADSTNAAPMGAVMRDQILNGSKDEYAQSEKMFLRSMVKSPEGLRAATDWAIASDKSVVARAFYEVVTMDLRPKLSQIKTPITIVYAWDASSPYPEAATDALYRNSYEQLSNKKMFRVDNSLHFIMFDQPEAFASKVDEFLK